MGIRAMKIKVLKLIQGQGEVIRTNILKITQLTNPYLEKIRLTQFNKHIKHIRQIYKYAKIIIPYSSSFPQTTD